MTQPPYPVPSGVLVLGPVWEDMGGSMPRKKHSVDQIIGKLRQAEVELSKGETIDLPLTCPHPRYHLT